MKDTAAFIAGFIQGSLHRHRLTALLTALVLAVGIAGMSTLRYSSDYRAYFSEDNPELQVFETIQQTYAKSDNVFIVIAVQDGDVFATDALDAVQWVVEQAWLLPSVLRVDAVTNFQATQVEGDKIHIGDLVAQPASRLSESQRHALRQRALSEPQLVGRLLSPDADVTAVNVVVQLPGVQPESELAEVAGAARALARELTTRVSGIDVHLTGIIMMNDAFPAASKADTELLFPVAAGIIGLLIFLFVGSLRIAIAIWITVLTSILASVGLAGWLGIDLTPPTMAAPIIILTLAVSDSIHLVAVYMDRKIAGHSDLAAMSESLRINLVPVFVTSLTTALGFLGMNFSDSPPFRDLGNIVAMGVMVAFFTSVLLLPSLILILRPKPLRRSMIHSRVTEMLADFVIRQQRPLLGLGLLLVLMTIVFLPRNELNDEFVKYVSEDTDFRRSTEFVAENLTGIYSIEYSLSSGRENGITEPGYLQTLERFSAWLEEQPEAAHVASILDIMRSLNRDMQGGNPDLYRLPDTREEIAQYLLLFEMSLPFGLDLTDRIDLAKSATRLTVTLSANLSSRDFIAFEERAAQWLAVNADGMSAIWSSPTMMFTHIGDRNIRQMLLGAAVALLMISGLLIIVFRSLSIGLISLVPNIAPACFAFGLWGLMSGRVGLGLSMVASLTIGIVVDNTVHLLNRYVRARRFQGVDPRTAVREALVSVGKVILVSNTILLAGFLTLVFADFTPNAELALLTSVTLMFALIADLFLLPPLLIMLDRKTRL